MKKIIELPCWIGDKVYFPHFDQYNWGEIDAVEFYSENGEPCFTYDVGDFGPDGFECWSEGVFLLSDIGKTVFLTQEEAEATEQYQKEKAEYEGYNKLLYEEFKAKGETNE